MRTKKQIVIWICSLALLSSCVFSPTAFAVEEEQPSDQPVSEDVPSQKPESEEGIDEPVYGGVPDEPALSDSEQEPEAGGAEQPNSGDSPAAADSDGSDEKDEQQSDSDNDISNEPGPDADEAEETQPGSADDTDDTPEPGAPSSEQPLPENPVDEPDSSDDPPSSEEPGTEETPSGEDAPPASENNIYTISLDTQIIGNGEYLFYETVSPSLAGNPFAADYYPGDLVVEIMGQIVIESGGSLVIGTMSEGDPSQASPIIRRDLLQDGLIVVKAGGSLTLKTVEFELSGDGLLIVQEPGGSVYFADTELDGVLIQWAPPMVDNTYHQPADLWLEEGTVLTEALLPASLKTNLQHQGVQQWTDIPIQWDMTAYEEQSSGELTLTGCFLDENGVELASSRPLELSVHWYKPDLIVVTAAVWMGETAASAKLQVEQLPDMATDIWGEVSADGGTTWERWEDFHVREDDESTACVFYLPDDMPRHFRICASFISKNYRQYWASDNFLLPEEDGDDGGGNRGGSITPVPPKREPEEPETEPEEPNPAPEPEAPESEPMPEPEPEDPETEPTPEPEPEDQEPDPVPEPEPEDPESVPKPEPEPKVDSETVPPLGTEPTLPISDDSIAASGETPDQPKEKNGLTPFSQAVLAVAGVGVCAATGITVTHKGILRKRKSK